MRLRAGVAGAASARVEAFGGREAVVVRIDETHAAGSLRSSDSTTVSEAADLARHNHVPLVGVFASGGAAVDEGIDALHAWGRAASAIAACSGQVPVVIIVAGPAVSGPALLLGLADVVIMTSDSYAFVSGPAMVGQLTGVSIDAHRLGGADIHALRTGVCALYADDVEQALALAAEVLSFLPRHSDEEPSRVPSSDSPGRLCP